jgi:hypothetical protein
MRQVDEPEYSHGKCGNPMKDKEQTNKLEYMQSIEDAAKEYRAHAVSSINKNSHMNRLGGDCGLVQDEIDAVLVDFINYCGMRQGLDYGLYAKDLGPEVPVVPVVRCPSHAAQQETEIKREKGIACEALLDQLVAARELADEEFIMGFVEDEDTNDVFKVTIQYIGNRADD